MEQGRWEKPITFETTKLGQYWTVTSTAEAARALMERWPVDTGVALQKARETCLAVLEGKAEPAAARLAFIEAAKWGGLWLPHNIRHFLPISRSPC